MKKWEYRCEVKTVNDARKFVPTLDEFGTRGWELVHCEFGNGNYMLIFKRLLRSDDGQKEDC